MQIDSNPLDLEILCDKSESPETYEMAFQALINEVSPLAYIASNELRYDFFHWDSLQHVTLKLSTFNQVPRENGFTKEQRLTHCKQFFAKGAAKLTIEFTDTDVMQIKMDKRFTLMDQFGIIGNDFNRYDLFWRPKYT